MPDPTFTVGCLLVLCLILDFGPPEAIPNGFCSVGLRLLSDSNLSGSMIAVGSGAEGSDTLRRYQGLARRFCGAPLRKEPSRIDP